MPRIAETIVTTIDASGAPHIAPLGLIEDGSGWMIAPFKPSRTLDNLRAHPFAVASHTEDVRVFAGCVTGRKLWPTLPAERIEGVRLAAALRHVELELAEQRDDVQRPVLRMVAVHEATHAPFVGFNRAQAAVIEGAVLVSRLHMLPPEKVETEMTYLQIAIDKTAGPEEREAWEWLRTAVTQHRAGMPERTS